IPPTAVGGSFKFSLQRDAPSLIPESHPRQWVDRSSSAYKEMPRASSPNPTHGSGWIVQVQPTKRCPEPHPRIPPTAVGGSFKSSLQRDAPSLIPESHPRQWVDRSSPAYESRLKNDFTSAVA